MIKNYIRYALKKIGKIFNEDSEKKINDCTTFIQSSRIANFLSPLLVNFSYLPLTDAAAGPHYYAHILNDIIINNKKNIVDIGSGISTILIARLLKINNIPASVISIDHDRNWQNIVNNILKRDGIDHYVSFITSPIIKSNKYTWYDKKKIVFPDNYYIDTLLVDGPIGMTSHLARLEAVPFLKKYLSSDCYTIYLHDTDRPDEKEIVRLWVTELPDAKVSAFNRYTLFSYGNKFEFYPQSRI